MIGWVLAAMIAWCDSHEELTSRALVYRGSWCSEAEMIWFAKPIRMIWFQDEARQCGAISNQSTLWPLQLREMDIAMDDIDVGYAIRTAVNGVRESLFNK